MSSARRACLHRSGPSTAVMPPRLHPHRLAQSTSTQCFRTRPQYRHEALSRSGELQPFHSSCRQETRLRRNMFAWLNGPGRVFRAPLQGSTNYLSAYDMQGNLVRLRSSDDDDAENEAEKPKIQEPEEEIVQREIEEGLSDEERERRAEVRAAARDSNAAGTDSGLPKESGNDLKPFPLNQHFQSQPVLSEELREELYRQVALRGLDVSTVSSVFGVDMRRVAACVRLKTLEKQWETQGKQLARPYAKAVMGMLPQTPYTAGRPPTPHESINDLPVHPKTRQQIFYPTSESRRFTREDAAKVFDEKLLPADKRIAHPDLIQIAKWELEGLSRDERREKLQELDDKRQEEAAEQSRKQDAWKARTQRVVQGRRWDFTFQDISVEAVGKDGRAKEGVGYRYGVPHKERKRGLIKIPTSV